MSSPPFSAPAPAAAARPSMPRSWRLLLRVTGAFALLLFLLPTVFVVKYYAFDRPREAARARLVSLARFTPVVAVDVVAPPLAPSASGNGAVFYARALQSWADRTTAGSALPRPEEAALFLEGARRKECRFFAPDPRARPLFVFHDAAGDGQPTPYRFPLSPREPYRYLGAAIGLTQALARLPVPPRQKIVLGRAIVRFGDALGREGATRTHLFVAQGITKTGLRLLLPEGGNGLKRYVYGQQAWAEAAQRKYALLEGGDADNLLLQARVARSDADPLWRREAVWALGETLRQPGLVWRRPLEALQAKATLSESAARDPDPSLRAAAAETLNEVARNGAVIRR